MSSADEKKAKKASKAEKKARLLEKQEEERRKQEELLEMEARVAELLAYKKPPSALQFLAAETPLLVHNPWKLILDVSFAHRYLDSLAMMFQLDSSGLSEEERIQYALVMDGIQDISGFTVGQPVFFFTDEEVLGKFVSLLQQVLLDETSFSLLASMLIPTVNNPRLTKQVLSSGLIGLLFQFTTTHMFATKVSADADEGADDDEDEGDQEPHEEKEQKSQEDEEEEDGNEQEKDDQGHEKTQDNEQEEGNDDNKQHRYSDDTFFAIMNMVKAISGTSKLRAVAKSYAKEYLHIRGLASGAIHGLTRERRLYAISCLKQFIADTSQEKAISQLGTQLNKAMLRYNQGHIHSLFCEGIALDPTTTAGAFGSRNRRSFTPGFANQSTLDTLNNIIKKKSHKARLK